MRRLTCGKLPDYGETIVVSAANTLRRQSYSQRGRTEKRKKGKKKSLMRGGRGKARQWSGVIKGTRHECYQPLGPARVLRTRIEPEKLNRAVRREFGDGVNVSGGGKKQTRGASSKNLNRAKETRSPPQWRKEGTPALLKKESVQPPRKKKALADFYPKNGTNHCSGKGKKAHSWAVSCWRVTCKERKKSGPQPEVLETVPRCRAPRTPVYKLSSRGGEKSSANTAGRGVCFLGRAAYSDQKVGYTLEKEGD